MFFPHSLKGSFFFNLQPCSGKCLILKKKPYVLLSQKSEKFEILILDLMPLKAERNIRGHFDLVCFSLTKKENLLKPYQSH